MKELKKKQKKEELEKKLAPQMKEDKRKYFNEC